jgi:hypothetical protein
MFALLHQSPKRVPKLALLTTGIIALSACSADSTGPSVPQVSGQWAYNASNLAGGGLSCSISGVRLILTQVRNTFSGSTNGGNLNCVAGAVTLVHSAIANDVIANGQINGNSVSFDIGTSDLHNTGTLSGNSLSGQLSARINTGSSILTLIGNFSAVRQ